MRAQHDDYDTATKAFVDAVNIDPGLREKWAQEGGTPSDAYEMGKRILEQRRFIDDPKAFESEVSKRVEAEVEKRLRADKEKRRGKTLADVNSAPIGNRAKGKVYDLDVFMKGPDKDHLVFSKFMVHKEAGKERYTWYEQDGVWKTKSVEAPIEKPAKKTEEKPSKEHPKEHPEEDPKKSEKSEEHPKKSEHPAEHPK